LLMVHTMAADNLTDRRNVHGENQWAKNWALRHTGSAVNRRWAVSAEVNKLMPLFDIWFKPLQGHVSDAKCVSEPRQQFTVIDGLLLIRVLNWYCKTLQFQLLHVFLLRIFQA